MKKCMIVLALILASIAFGLSGCSSTDTEQEDTDWSVYPIIIDGQGLRANIHTAAGSDFPTHVPLIPVAEALGADVDIQDGDPMRISLTGRRGLIRFTVGSDSFNVGNDTVSLWQPSLLVDDEIYVPIPFFRDVFGMGNAMWMGGHVYIDTQASDMQ